MPVMINRETKSITWRRWLGVARPLCVIATLMPIIGCGASHIIASDTSAFNKTNAAPQVYAPRVYRVPSLAMEPTLPIGTRVSITKQPPAIGSIVVFNPPGDFEEEKCGPQLHSHRVAGAACNEPSRIKSKIRLIRRIIAGPNDEIYIRDGYVYTRSYSSRYFIREKGFYVRTCTNGKGCNFPIPIKIPAGHWFLMGDNRGESDDSRFWGPVPTAWIVGTVTDYRRPKL